MSRSRTPTEAKLAAIIAELLALPGPVGVSDNFFALGGHSLTATKLMARIRTAYGVDLPIRTLFTDPTVAGLAAALTAAGGGEADASGPPRRPRRADPGGARAGHMPPALVPGDRR
jgi:acyl carrier protein